MHNVYSFNTTATCNTDKRKVEKTILSADGASLDKAWDKAERKALHMYPNHTVSLTVGNRQPMALRPAVKECEAA